MTMSDRVREGEREPNMMQLLQNYRGNCLWFHPSGSDFLKPSCGLAHPNYIFHDGHKFTIHNTFYMNVSEFIFTSWCPTVLR